jgi:hypothetical protein
LDAQRPDWGRPAPEFVDPLFVARAERFEAGLQEAGEHPCGMIPITAVAAHAIDDLERIFLGEAVRRRLTDGG